MKISKKHKTRSPVNIGDLIQIPCGPAFGLRARVLEDRGLIGKDRRRMLWIETLGEWEETRQRFEVAEDDVKILRRKRTSVDKMGDERKSKATA